MSRASAKRTSGDLVRTRSCLVNFLLLLPNLGCSLIRSSRQFARCLKQSQAPLEECCTLEPQMQFGNMQTTNADLVQFYLGDFGISPPVVSSRASLKQHSAEENLHRVALQICGRVSTHRMAFTALATAVSGRCVSMLRSGFWSMEEAVAAMPLLGDLWRAGLLKAPGTGDAARAAVAKALAVLVCGGRKEGSGSFLGLSSRPSSTSSGSRETMDQRLRRWCRSCELFEDVWISHRTCSKLS